MELSKNTQVFFDETSHSYTNSDGELLIGVTSLMAKHGLSPNYDGIPQAVLAKAAEEGTAIHKMLQAYDEGELVPTSPLLESYRKLGLKHIQSEYLVSDNELVATSLDKVYEAGKNQVDIADVKTTQKVHKRALEWQLGIGKVLFERQNPGIKVRNAFCIWCDKKGQQLKDIVPIQPVSEEEVDALLDAEKNGLIYTDNPQVQDASLVFEESQLATFADNSIEKEKLENSLKILKEANEAIKSTVKDYMLSKGLTEMTCPNGVFKLKGAYERTSVDPAKLQKDYPTIYSKVVKTTIVKESVTFKPNK